MLLIFCGVAVMMLLTGASLNPSMSVRVVFSIDAALTNRKTLFELSIDRGSGYIIDDAIRVSIEGSSTGVSTAGVKSKYENNLLTRVYNTGFSCADSGLGCGYQNTVYEYLHTCMHTHPHT